MIVLLTYDRPHRKTQDVLFELVMRRYEVTVLAFPWVKRKRRQPLLPHRPGDSGFCMGAKQIPNADLFAACGYDYEVVEPDNMYDAIRNAKPSRVVVGGSGILEPRIVDEWEVLNVHPGILPDYRGLDAMKWALLERGCTGVTAHLCDQRPDAGAPISRQYLIYKPGEEFSDFCVRHYEAEIAMFPKALELLCDGTTDVSGDSLESYERILTTSPVRKRMSMSTEKRLKRQLDELCEYY